MGDGQGLLRGEGRGEVPGPDPAPGSKCCGTISSISSSISPGVDSKPKNSDPTFIISTLVCVQNYDHHSIPSMS